MLFKAAILEAIAAGRVTLAFRRWTRPSVRTGGTLRTAIGVLAIDAVEAVAESDISDADARAAGHASRAALLAGLPSEGTLYRIAFRRTADDPRHALRRSDDLTAMERAEIGRRLAAIDRRSSDGAWTWRCLRLIAEAEGRPAVEIAGRLGLDAPTTKRRIRHLKELGLTESLSRGYRLSPRGRALLTGFDPATIRHG